MLSIFGCPITSANRRVPRVECLALLAPLASGVVQAPAPSHVGRQLNRGEEKVEVEQQILAVLAALAGYNYQHQQSAVSQNKYPAH